MLPDAFQTNILCQFTALMKTPADNIKDFSLNGLKKVPKRFHSIFKDIDLGPRSSMTLDWEYQWSHRNRLGTSASVSTI